MIRCKYHDDDTYGQNYTCIPFEKRLEKKVDGNDHPCPFKDFAECKEWMEGEKFELLWRVWLKKYDPGGLDSAGFYRWSRLLAKIDPEYIWEFMEKTYPYLRFIGYEDVSWTDREQLIFKLELLDFSALNKDPPEDCCINENCNPYSCMKYIVCPMIHNRRELIAMGIPKDIKKTRSYNRWKWHLNKSKRIRSGEEEMWSKENRKEAADKHLAKVIWFAFRELAAKDLASTSTIRHRGYDMDDNQCQLEIKVDEF